MSFLRQPPAYASIGRVVELHYGATLRQKISELCGGQVEGFPCSRRSRLDMNHLRILEDVDYFVCRKSNGTRCVLLLIAGAKGPETFLLDHENSLYYMEVAFPLPNKPQTFHNDTLIDGHICQTATGSWEFVALDLIAIEGVSVLQRSFSTRLGILQQDIIKPAQEMIHTLPEYAAKVPFTIQMQKQERSYGLGIIATQCRQDNIPLDGLVFTPVRSPYTPGGFGRPHRILEWRPPELSTLIFKIRIQWDKERKPHYQIMVSDQKAHRYYDDISPEQSLAQMWRQTSPDGRLAEFRYDKTWRTLVCEHGYAGEVREGGWRFVRFRDDVELADDDREVKASWNSIHNPIPFEVLEGRVDVIRAKWKAREKAMANMMASPISGLPKRKSVDVLDITIQRTYSQEIGPAARQGSIHEETKEYAVPATPVSRRGSGQGFSFSRETAPDSAGYSKQYEHHPSASLIISPTVSRTNHFTYPPERPKSSNSIKNPLRIDEQVEEEEVVEVGGGFTAGPISSSQPLRSPRPLSYTGVVEKGDMEVLSKEPKSKSASTRTASSSSKSSAAAKIITTPILNGIDNKPMPPNDKLVSPIKPVAGPIRVSTTTDAPLSGLFSPPVATSIVIRKTIVKSPDDQDEDVMISDAESPLSDDYEERYQTIRDAEIQKESPTSHPNLHKHMVDEQHQQDVSIPPTIPHYPPNHIEPLKHSHQATQQSSSFLTEESSTISTPHSTTSHSTTHTPDRPIKKRRTWLDIVLD